MDIVKLDMVVSEDTIDEDVSIIISKIRPDWKSEELSRKVSLILFLYFIMLQLLVYV